MCFTLPTILYIWAISKNEDHTLCHIYFKTDVLIFNSPDVPTHPRRLINWHPLQTPKLNVSGREANA